MAFYEIDEGRLVVPDGWEDRTVNSLEYGTGEAGMVKVVVSRHQHRGRKLAAMADQVLEDMRRRLAGFELVERNELSIDDEPAIEVLLRFKDGALVVVQRSIWLLVGSKCVTLGVVHSAPTPEDLEARTAEADAVYDEIKKTLRRRQPGEGALGAAPPIGAPPPGATGA